MTRFMGTVGFESGKVGPGRILNPARPAKETNERTEPTEQRRLSTTLTPDEYANSKCNRSHY